SVAVSPNGGAVYVANTDSDTVSVIDTATSMVTATIIIGPSPAFTEGPVGVAVTPDGGTVYVASLGDESVSVIDTTSNTVASSISVGAGLSAIGRLCHIAAPRAQSVGGSGIVRPLRLPSATCPSPRREACGAF